MLNLEEQYAHQFKFGKPIVFQEAVLLHPVKFQDVDLFKLGISAFLYNPLDYPDLELSVLPRLYFLSSILVANDRLAFFQQHPLLYQLFECLRLTLNLVLGEEQSYQFVAPNGRIRLEITGNAAGESKTVTLTSADFDLLREIILQQNGCDYNDDFVHEDIRKYLEEEDQKNRENDTSITTEEDSMEAVMMELGIYDEKIVGAMTMRRYNHILTKLFQRETYKIQQTAAMSGFVKFEEKIPHWLARQKMEARYKRAFKKL